MSQASPSLAMGIRDATGEAFELKGTVSTLTVLRLLSADVEALEHQLGNKVRQLPHFFRNAPVVLDFGRLGAGVASLHLGELVARIRQQNVVPVAFRRLDQQYHEAALAAGLGRLDDRTSPPRRPNEGLAKTKAEVTRGTADEQTPAPVANGPRGMIVRQPVRAGQVIYAQQSDVTILAPINPGGEVIADGSVHVYGALRGRVLAGAHGNTEACIFCSSLQAELVAVAGAYVRAEEIPAVRRRKPSQVRLSNGQLLMEAL